MKPLDICAIRFRRFAVLPAVDPSNPFSQVLNREVVHWRYQKSGCDILICKIDHALRDHSGEHQRFDWAGHAFESKNKGLDVRVVLDRNEFGVMEAGQ
jgi:hypothetical protein